MRKCFSLSPPHKARVLVLTSTFPRWVGDSEPEFVFALCQRLSLHFDVWVLAPHAPGSATYEVLAEGFRVVRYRYFFEWGETLAYQGGVMAKLRDNRWRYLLVAPFILGQFAALLCLLVKHRFDVVHAHWLFPQGTIAAMIKYLQLGRLRLVCTAHGTDLHGLRGGLFACIKRFTVAQSNAFTLVSESMRLNAQLQGIDVRAAAVIPMGVDAKSLFKPDQLTRRSESQLLFVGRLDEKKGLDVLISALPAVIAVHPDCTLKIVGDGPEKRAYLAQAATLGVSTKVEFVGAVPNKALPQYYREAALFVFPSTGLEGLGLVCAEALACECPVVASDLPAVKEVVKNPVSGVVFRVGDVNDLAAKLVWLLADPTLRATLGSAGRKHALAQFDWEPVTESFVRVLEGTLE